MPLRLPNPLTLQTQTPTRLLSTKPTLTPTPKNEQFNLLPATPRDSPSITDVFLHSFSDPFSRRMFPLTNDVRNWWVDHFRTEIQSTTSACASTPRTAFLKVTTADGVVAAFAKWKLPTPKTPEESIGKVGQGATVWPPSADADLCTRFFALMESEKGRVMGGREFFYLDMLGTLPEYNGQGIGSRLLRWGLERADAAGVETFLSSTPQGRGLYERYGFRVDEPSVISAVYYGEDESYCHGFGCSWFEDDAMIKAPYEHNTAPRTSMRDHRSQSRYPSRRHFRNRNVRCVDGEKGCKTGVEHCAREGKPQCSPEVLAEIEKGHAGGDFGGRQIVLRRL
ncbi:GNAT family N-acetyltransferase [Aspergillus ibericus CBS 121593]|uniref:N-acetyltransferase domain-containing protein n=1 Tax=Aspergillus ibericus CBS 121593 TaxID=1448316 RepID=A0A395H885_9EURO|nr:hypothetical protein BO80DRAFT_500170 [Aspergillus ibericus CBS 121593]RAL03880.1 hypothetical protein BO80DRAFT_500170 [Aspergillus ibericus CBS 121593]